MPTLPREPDLFPSNLLTEPATSQWWAAHTLARREKDLMRRLRVAGVPHYGPLIARRRRTPAGRTSTAHVPLFPGYVFVQADQQQRLQTLQTNCIASLLPVAQGNELSEQLLQIYRLIDLGTPLTLEARLTPGQKVRVRSGLLAGIEGTILSRRGSRQLLVSIAFLQQGASLALEDHLVDPID